MTYNWLWHPWTDTSDDKARWVTSHPSTPLSNVESRSHVTDGNMVLLTTIHHGSRTTGTQATNQGEAHLPLPFTSNTQSRCHVAVSKVATKWWMMFIIHLFCSSITAHERWPESAWLVATTYITYSWAAPWNFPLSCHEWNERNFHSFVAPVSFQVFADTPSFHLGNPSFLL